MRTIRHILSRFVRHLLFLDKEERAFSQLAWLIVLHGVLVFMAFRKVFK